VHLLPAANMKTDDGDVLRAFSVRTTSVAFCLKHGDGGGSSACKIRFEDRRSCSCQLFRRECLNGQQKWIAVVASLALAKVFEKGLRRRVGSFDEHVVADQKAAEVCDSGNVAGVSRAVELRVLRQLDLRLDRAAAFDGDRAAAERSQFLARGVD